MPMSRDFQKSHNRYSKAWAVSKQPQGYLAQYIYIYRCKNKGQLQIKLNRRLFYQVNHTVQFNM
ncbi:hypothetical protein OIU84_015125 [Salix udensis]|uniref:Uncharacterized protein n=1 Tax=Salix udensis TaxID=889485 RepID=A0AAD6NS62_9ROSI|nr:hypothetical protein OIU84_015125 [Salix udensis]